MNLTMVLGLLGGCAGLLAMAKLAQGAWRLNRRIVRIADAVTELSPNSGHSIKDTVHRVESKIDRTEKKVGRTEKKAGRTEAKLNALAAQLEEHITSHPGS